MTPEGRVKREIKKVLDKHNPSVYYYMPVPYGYGKQSLDFIGAAWGRAFAIEAKAFGEEPTSRQEGTIDDMRAAGMKVFTIDGPVGVGELGAWLNGLAWQFSGGGE